MMRNDLEIARRIVRSYEMMLNFYGMELVNPKTGEIKRSKQWKSRYNNLNRNSHNFLRISKSKEIQIKIND